MDDNVIDDGSAGSGQPAPSRAMILLAEYLGSHKHVMTNFEAIHWGRLIEEVGDEAVENYLLMHMRSGNEFAPKASAAFAALDPVGGDADSAFAELTKLVTKVGPYRAPPISQPVMKAAIIEMGGWAKVCETLPDPGVRFEFDAFRKRFLSAFKLATSDVLRNMAPTTPLIGLHDSSAPIAIEDARTSALIEAHRVDRSRG